MNQLIIPAPHMYSQALVMYFSTGTVETHFHASLSCVNIVAAQLDHLESGVFSKHIYQQPIVLKFAFAHEYLMACCERG